MKFRTRDLISIFVLSKIFTIGIAYFLLCKFSLSSLMQSLVVRGMELIIFFGLLLKFSPFRTSSIIAKISSFPKIRFTNITILAAKIFLISIISRILIEWCSIVLAGIFDPEILEIDSKNLTAPPPRVETITIIPIVEELIYRGAILYYLSLSYKFPKTILVSSMIFAIFHENPIAALLGGIFFGLIYAKTGFLWTSILAHATSNLTIILIYRMKPMSLIWLNFYKLFPISFLLCVLLVIWLAIIVKTLINTSSIKQI